MARISFEGQARTVVDMEQSAAVQYLLDHEHGRSGYAFEDDGKYYVTFTDHNSPWTEITKEKYDYIQGLKKALEYLRKEEQKERDLLNEFREFKKNMFHVISILFLSDRFLFVKYEFFQYRLRQTPFCKS